MLRKFFEAKQRAKQNKVQDVSLREVEASYDFAERAKVLEEQKDQKSMEEVRAAKEIRACEAMEAERASKKEKYQATCEAME